ncbi:hypothetical protein GJ744_012403 [Endocarpon pusillum]|uniref:Uncharacterized protein n=1 Tax=Endocarpon pusillum TaxID=364733 RepID=A0A8H7E447_9EURO|nr:hypothetical protein GJ744_012403 [Endocarpon pusillum]
MNASSTTAPSAGNTALSTAPPFSGNPIASAAAPLASGLTSSTVALPATNPAPNTRPVVPTVAMFTHLAMSPGIHVSNVYTGLLQTTRIGNTTYVKLSAKGSPLLRHPGVDILRAATLPGAVWKDVPWVDHTEPLNLPVLLDAVPLPVYRADSILEMERMRELQWAVAKANFENSPLGRLPRDVWIMISEYWKQHVDPEPGVRSPNDDWRKVDERHVPCLRLLRTCRYLYHELKDDILGKAVLYFRTPDTISSFHLSQELAPMTMLRPNYLHTVILDIRDNANWPLKTEVRGVTTSLPTNPVEWEARIKRFAPDSSVNNTLGRFLARGNKALMEADWGRASRQLLTNFAVKNLIVRGNRGFVTALAAMEPSSET